MVSTGPITSRRLSLVALDAPTLALMEAGDAPMSFRWPDWWPDDVDRDHMALWRRRAREPDGINAWGPRAVVNTQSQMVGHAGFHLPPQPMEQALADPSYEGLREGTAGGVVEIGYTIFPEYRRRGYATEVVTALVAWAWSTGAVSSILAAVAEDNEPSVGVLERVGGFHLIGRCRTNEDGVELVYRLDR
jgi:RimJ/RimL family protein N-acetyltransferase